MALRKKATPKKASGKAKRPLKSATVEARPVVAEIIEPGESVPEPGETAPESEEFRPDFSEMEELVPPVAAPSTKLPALKSDVETSLAPTDPVALYLSEIRKYPLLTPEQERELAVRYRETGDAKAAEALVTSNLRFVVKVAAEYSKFGARLIDLIQEGNIGLMQAVREFNPYKGVRLITYAVWWIRGYIQEYLMRQYSLVRIGTTQNQRKLFYQLQRQREELEAMGKDPDYALLSHRLGIPEKEIETMQQRLMGRDISLNQPLDDHSDTSLLDLQANSMSPSVDDQLGHQEELALLRENIERIRDDLSDKELYILDHRLLSDEPMTLQELGERFGTTREAVRQVEQRLINKIKKVFNASSGIEE